MADPILYCQTITHTDPACGCGDPDCHWPTSRDYHCGRRLAPWQWHRGTCGDHADTTIGEPAAWGVVVAGVVMLVAAGVGAAGLHSGWW